MELFVLGMHHSGVEECASLLEHMGVQHVPPAPVWNASSCSTRPKGREEGPTVHASVMRTAGLHPFRFHGTDLHRAVAALSDTEAEPVFLVARQLARTHPSMIADPLLTFLLPIYRRVSPASVCVYVYRNPLEVAETLRANEAIPVTAGVALWHKYVALGLRATAGMTRILLDHRQVLTNPGAAALWLYQRLKDIGFSSLHHPSEYEPEKPLSLEGLPTKPSLQESQQVLAGATLDLYMALQNHCVTDGFGQVPAFVDEILAAEAQRQVDKEHLQTLNNKVSRARDENDLLTNKVNTLSKKLQRLQHKYATLKSEHASVIHSRSWKTIVFLKRARTELRSIAEPAVQIDIQGWLRQRLGRTPFSSHKNSGEACSSNPFEQALASVRPLPTKRRLRRLVYANEQKARRWFRRHVGVRPTVSIVMPTFNRGHLIAEAIKSVQHQSYQHWELIICNDGSTDSTEAVVGDFQDDRIRCLSLPHRGAAAARNAGLEAAHGEILAYLDTDNVWHPRFLETCVAALTDSPGRFSVYTSYIDIEHRSGTWKLNKAVSLPFDYTALESRNFIDLNTFVHRRVLYELFGGFDEHLSRQQDWNLILKYTYPSPPLYVDAFMVAYRRHPKWRQITRVNRLDESTTPRIRRTLASYYHDGLPMRSRTPKVITIVAWDICRNHFSKAYNLAEALAVEHDVQLIGFRLFDEPIFPPYAQADPAFETLYLESRNSQEFRSSLAQAVESVRGDLIYAVKPRLPSLGLALLANHHHGTPFILEVNDLETVVSNPGQRSETGGGLAVSHVDPGSKDLDTPYSQLWSKLMEHFAGRVPFRATHNRNLDEYFGGGAFLQRNLKDEAFFDPNLYDRRQIRRALGYEDWERIIFFGGMVRRHKGVFELVKAFERLGEPHFKLLFVGSRETPDQRQLEQRYGSRVRILPPRDRNEMAPLTYAADYVVLWLDPRVHASHYQMPYKLTDALAMEVPVLANRIGDLGNLVDQGIIREVGFGDYRGLAKEILRLDNDDTLRSLMTEKGRKLYLREFSYRAARVNFELIFSQLPGRGTLPLATEFASFFANVRQKRKPAAG